MIHSESTCLPFRTSRSRTVCPAYAYDNFDVGIRYSTQGAQLTAYEPGEHELLDDVERLDMQLKASHKRIKTAVQASGTKLTDLYGVGPILACELIGYTGDVRRFTSGDQFASYAGVAPVELSSGGRTVHRLSRRGNRQLNHAIHMVAICQIRQTDSEGRIYFEKKVAEGKTKREAIRSLKRHVANAVYRQLLLDATK